MDWGIRIFVSGCIRVRGVNLREKVNSGCRTLLLVSGHRPDLPGFDLECSKPDQPWCVSGSKVGILRRCADLWSVFVEVSQELELERQRSQHLLYQHVPVFCAILHEQQCGVGPSVIWFDVQHIC